MGWLSWIVVGLIAGWLAGMVVKGGGFGMIGNIIVGVVGGLLGVPVAAAISVYFEDILKDKQAVVEEKN